MIDWETLRLQLPLPAEPGRLVVASIGQATRKENNAPTPQPSTVLKCATFSVGAGTKPGVIVSEQGLCAPVEFSYHRRRHWRHPSYAGNLLNREVNLLARVWNGWHHVLHHVSELQASTQEFVADHLVFWHRSSDGTYVLGREQLGTESTHTRPALQAKLWKQKAQQAERARQLSLAAEYYHNALSEDPYDADTWARLSKQYSDMTYQKGMTVPNVREVNSKAIEYGYKALEQDPSCILGHVAVCVSKGRLALFSDNQTKVRLAKEAQDQVKVALRIDPTHDLALHLMGRWHYEMASVNVVVRTLVRLLYGTELMAGSYREALLFYQAAATSAPERLVHRVELARTSRKLGDTATAIRELEVALTLDADDLNAYLLQEDAKAILKDLKPRH